MRGTAAALLMLGSLVSACASGADPMAMVPVVAEPNASNSVAHRRIAEVTTTGGEETDPLWTSEISSTDFNKALLIALQNNGFIDPSGDLTLQAQLVEVDQPLFGAALEVTTTVQYRIKNSNGAVAFDEAVRSSYTAAFSDAFIGVERLKLANEGSARENIAAFMRRISQIASTRGGGPTS